MIQGSPEWHAIRLGKVTASRVADIIAKTSKGPAASRANYLAELVCERLTGRVAESFKSEAMNWGTANEPEAREAYEFYAGATVEQIAFMEHPTIEHAGCSPDGLVGDVGLIEIKAPATSTHLEYLLTKKIPAKYITQMMWQMACCQRSYCDFVSYDPRLPENLRLFIKRVHRDEATIKELETEVAAFLLEISVKLSELNSQYGLPEVA